MNVYEGIVYRDGDGVATFVCVARTKQQARIVMAKHLELFSVVDPTIEYHMRKSLDLDYVGDSNRPHVLIFRMDHKPTRIIPQPSVN